MTARLTTYRYASVRQPGEGLRIGVARLAPRGIRCEDRQRLHYFDLWLPLLAPATELVPMFRRGDLSLADFSHRYRRGLQTKEARQAIELLAGFSLFLPISLGCYCADETRCHRSILRKVIAAEAIKKKKAFLDLRELQASATATNASPVCYLPEFEEENS